MQVNISGRHIDVGEALHTYCEEKMHALQRHFTNIVDIKVTMGIENNHRHVVEVTANASGLVLRARGEGTDLYAAVDMVEEKLVRQLEKYKGRMQKHRKRRQELAAQLGGVPQLQTTEHTMDEAALEEAPEDIFAEYMPKIVHKEIRHLQTLSVDEAVMQMDLLHMSFYIFQNAKSGMVNVVYRREDGTVAWVEPDAAVAA